MTTDKIRAAAQKLLDAHDSIAILSEIKAGWDSLRAALAEPTRSERMREAGFTRRPSYLALPSDDMDGTSTEPAQAAPADDAVPVVPVVAEVVEHDYGATAIRNYGYGPLELGDKFVRQSDHLAAMEALRADLGRLYGVLADELRQSRDENERLKAQLAECAVK